eukprot:SAG22_NODE_450_length_10398_cov_8.760171_7_plen_36_part_00
MSDKAMTMAIAQSWVLDKIYIYIYNNHPKMRIHVL